MAFKDSFGAVARRWRVVAVVLILILGGGLAYTLAAQRMYVATAQIFVSITGADSGSAADLNQGNSFVQARVQSYTSVATSPKVTEAVVADLNLGVTPDELANQISAQAPINTVLIDLSVRDASPAQAQRIANAVAIRFSSVVGQLEQTPNGGSPVKLTVTQPAKLPSTPASPNQPLVIGLALLVGLVLGVAAAYVRDMSDTSLKTREGLADATGLPVLATVPFDRTASQDGVVFRSNARSARAEAYRQLRTNMQFIDVDNPPKLIAVTSALPGEGKTATAMNIAAASAEAGLRVCLVECDLRKPTIANALGLIAEVGLTSILVNELAIEDAIQNAGKNLAVLTSGKVPPNPSELLVSEQTRSLLGYIAAKVDLVVLDTAPILPVADGAEIAALSDATILVVRHGKTRRDQVAKAVDNLGQAGVRPVGTILSMTPPGRVGKYNYYEYGSAVSSDSDPAHTPA